MRYFFCFVLTICLYASNAQSNNNVTVQGPDSINATFVPANMIAKYDIAIVSGVDYIDIVNVYEPTEVTLFDLCGKLVFSTKIDQRTRIQKDNFAKGFYLIKTRSVKMEVVKKIYL
jgi:hypothetical protein